MPGDVTPSWSFRKTIHQIKKKLNRFNNRFVFLIPAESGEKVNYAAADVVIVVIVVKICQCLYLSLDTQI